MVSRLQISGISVTLSATDSSTITFQAPFVDKAEIIELMVTVTDEDGNKATATVEVSVSDIPVKANKGNSGGSFGLYILAIILLLSFKKVVIYNKQ